MDPTERRTYNYYLAYHGCDPWRTMKDLEARYQCETISGDGGFVRFVARALDCPELADAEDAVANYREGVARQQAISAMEREAGL